MPRYFFHVREGSDLDRDGEGQEFADVEAARREAINSVREILGEKLLHGGVLNQRRSRSPTRTAMWSVINAREVLLKGGQFRSYSDDIMQSDASKAATR